MIRTPWGAAQSVKPVGDEGILFASTASHGGFYVPDALLDRIPLANRRWAMKWSASPNWYEEDCCWAAVALAFPSLFTEEQRETARLLADRYCPEA